MFITYTEYATISKQEKGYNGVTSFSSGYESVRLICQLPDGETETILLQEVVHVPGSFNVISQSRVMDKDVKVELVNLYGLNLYNRHCKLIATAPQVDGQFILNQAPESTEYTNLDDSFLLAFMMTGHASRNDAEKRMVQHCRWAHVGLKAWEILPTITDAPRLTGKCDSESCIKCKLTRQSFTPNMTSRATEPLQLLY